ncbi:MAG: hypothetical protein K0Q76_1225, partial [Panacagrimonas sp.]|nr:hypothetical protein [Panacagrimonas sp.]
MHLSRLSGAARRIALRTTVLSALP